MGMVMVSDVRSTEYMCLILIPQTVAEYLPGQFIFLSRPSRALSLIFASYSQNDPQHLSGLVRRILYQFIGPN
jgi:hypothetical protein